MKKNPALIIIDMQNDFVTNQNSPVYIKNGKDIVNPILKVKEYFYKNNYTIINIITLHKKDKSNWGKKDLFLDRYYCIENTEGSKIIDELKPLESEITIEKSLYSGFYKTDLKNILEQKQVNSLYFSGLTTGCCVSSTARDAYNLNYDLFFIADCLTSTNIKANKYELQFFNKSLGKVINSFDYFITENYDNKKKFVISKINSLKREVI